MLINHKLRIVKNDFIQNLVYERPSFTTDGRQFSCVVSQDYELKNNDSILLQINYGDSIRVSIDVNNFIEQGWVEIDTDYPLLNYTQTTPDYINGGSSPLEWIYFMGDDGAIKSGYKNSDGDYVFPELDYAVSTNLVDTETKSIITIPIKYYIENGIITYHNESISVKYDEDGNVAWAQQLIDGTFVKVMDGEREKWQNKTHVYIVMPNDIPLPLDDVTLGKHEAYTVLDGEEYIFDERYAKDGDRYYRQRYISQKTSGKNKDYFEGEYNDETGELISNLTSTEGYKGFYPFTIKLWDNDKTIHKIEDRIVPSNDGQLLILYVNSDSFINIFSSDTIIAQRLQSTNTPCYLEYDENLNPIRYDAEHYAVKINDIIYPVETVKMLDFSGLRELYEGDDNLYYVILETGKKVFFKKKSEKTYTLLLNKDVSYELIEKNKVVYNNIAYYKDIDNVSKEIEEGGSSMEYAGMVPFLIPIAPVYTLKIIGNKNPNIYYCRLYDDTSNPLDPFYDNYKSWIYKDIAIHKGKYIFKLQPNLFFPDKNLDFNRSVIFESDNTGIVDPLPAVSIQKITSELNIPVGLCTLHGTNLNQENDVNSKFVEEKVKGVINRIVDMEKDIYYPAVIGDEDKLVDVTDINFYLHLRTRNDIWEIENDNIAEVEDIFGKDFINDETKDIIAKDNTATYDFKSRNTSWNLFDYYPNFCNTLKNDSSLYNENVYYQPSDLLGFFDFSDDDIFYQKTKIGKTFLRMSFYDSKDPQTQSLLGTSTVFFNSREIFGKFIDVMSNPDPTISYKNPKTWIGGSSTISGNREPIKLSSSLEKTGFVDYNNMITTEGNGIEVNIGPTEILDESVRMGASVNISNKYATEGSAEGFYNYIFREYSNGLHERTIYLRIQLNHAGHGQVIDLFQPMVKNENGLYRIAKFNEINKRGIDLKSLYDMMYIPIKIKYDFDLKKYCWYLPKDMVPHKENKIKFNLYEIKINKDLSY